ncbi:enoyl-CoA hydratase/isomerase family protein [Patescibacteria group bacterium]
MIEFQQLNDRGLILLHRPDFNYFNTGMCSELGAQLTSCATMGLKGLVIGTRLRHWSVGADIDEHFPGPDNVERMLPAFHSLIRRIATFPIPIIAAINGAVMGGGYEVARACRWVVAIDPDHTKIALPEITLACFPPFGVATLLHITDDPDVRRQILRFIMLGHVLKCKEPDDLRLIKDAGLIDDVSVASLNEFASGFNFDLLNNIPNVSDRCNNPLDVTVGWIQGVLADDGEALRSLSRHALLTTCDALGAAAAASNFNDALSTAETEYLNRIVPHPDYTEGLTAAGRGRIPVWKASGFPG